MEIVFVREKQNSTDILSQVKNSVISRIQIPVDLTNKETETYILPVVPENNPFARITDVKNYKGLTADYNISTHRNLRSFEWSSIFPVNKGYSWQHFGSNMNGYDYVDFLDERQKNELPFRLIAYEKNPVTRTGANIADNITGNTVSLQNILSTPIRTFFDGFVLVKKFEYVVDKVRDLKYTLTLEEFNTDIIKPEIDWREVGVSSAGNVITRYALKSAGLI